MLSCNGVVTEANRISKICLEIHEHFDSNGRNEIRNLMFLIKAKEACYTAAGFFQLKKSTLFAILNIITTHFIILIQFHQKNSLNKTV